MSHHLTPGRIIYLGYHAPRAWVARMWRAGGPWQQWIDARSRAAMQTAALHLPARPAAHANARGVHFLTGRRYWYQTAFCCWTLCQHAAEEIRPIFVDDGTFDRALCAEMTRVFPGAGIEMAANVEARLDEHLPAKEFPALRGQRRNYLHLRKLTDVHAGRAGWRVVLDSDMLFFRQPIELLRAIDSAKAPVHMVDVKDSYGYPASTLVELAASWPVPRQINVGIVGLTSDNLDWRLLETWCAELLRRHGTSYYLEQAIAALWLSREGGMALPADDYRVLPDDKECLIPRAVMHHYVDTSKRGYFRHAWRRAVAAMKLALVAEES